MSGKLFFLFPIDISFGGGNSGSKDILNYIIYYANALSNILGIILANTGDESSRHGFVFTSISQGRN